jgi:HPt (histidine-containing phosphotransfer) domain-containing protein
MTEPLGSTIRTVAQPPRDLDAAVPEPSAKPVDLAHLSRQTMGNRALEIEILQLFEAQSRQLMHLVLVGRTAEERRRAAHTMRGSARGIGAWRVARLAEAVEHAGLVPGQVHGLLAELESAVDEANLYIQNVFKR